MKNNLDKLNGVFNVLMPKAFTGELTFAGDTAALAIEPLVSEPTQLRLFAEW